MTKPKEDERTAWAVLALSEARLYAQTRSMNTSHLTPEDRRRIRLLMDVNNQARTHLVKTFGLNLDNVFDKAALEYQKLWAECTAKLDAEDARDVEIDRLIRGKLT